MKGICRLYMERQRVKGGHCLDHLNAKRGIVRLILYMVNPTNSNWWNEFFIIIPELLPCTKCWTWVLSRAGLWAYCIQNPTLFFAVWWLNHPSLSLSLTHIHIHFTKPVVKYFTVYSFLLWYWKTFGHKGIRVLGLVG